MPALYIEPNALEPSAVRAAGASVRAARPSSGVKSSASKVTIGTFLVVLPSLVTSAERVPSPLATATVTAANFRSRSWAPVKRMLPLNSASSVSFFASYVPLPCGKRNRAPPSWAPSASVHLPWPMEPVTYSRKVRRTPQSTAASSKRPAFSSSFFSASSFFSPSSFFLSGAEGFGSAAPLVSTERLTGSSGVPSV